MQVNPLQEWKICQVHTQEEERNSHVSRGQEDEGKDSHGK